MRYYNALSDILVPRRGDGSACRHQRLALTLQNKATVSFWFLQQAYNGLRFGLQLLPPACATPPPRDAVYEPDPILGFESRQPAASACLGQT